MRLASGAEALVARVLTTGGVAGFGFSLGTEATPARDMAAWDALGRSRNLPLYAFFGGRMRHSVVVTSGEPDGMLVNPFDVLSIEAVLAECRPRKEFGLVTPHDHPWELAYCAALAAALQGNVKIVVSGTPPVETIGVSDAPGIVIDWPIEPAFAGIPWYPR